MIAPDPKYASQLTPLEHTYIRRFLEHLAPDARVLDVGAGGGRFAAAFRALHKEIVVDLLDQYPPNPDLISKDWPGDVIQNDIVTFRPKRTYDAVWMRNVLFLLPEEAVQPVFHIMTASLRPGGIMDFTMLKSDENFKLLTPGLTRQGVAALLADNDLTPILMEERDVPYRSLDGRTLPTFFIQARKARLTA
ncbi:MAG: class I SAM-dependent methyltransferase [Alphaproteobacteria bacterium]|nr:class I SAM-dependent methyltransferase [Alphaproteobacteria bacterium]